MVKRVMTFGVVALFLLSCSSKESQSLAKVYAQKQNHYKYLQKTEKLQLQENNVTKVLVTATYMNRPTINNDDKSDEVFLVGLYSEDKEIESLTQERLHLTLKDVKTKEESRKDRDEYRKLRKAEIEKLRAADQNLSLIKEYDKEITEEKKKKLYLDPIDIKVVPKGDRLLNGISFVSDWNQFYLVHFKHIEGNRLQLQIKSEDLNTTGTLNFAKVAKYAL